MKEDAKGYILGTGSRTAPLWLKFEVRKRMFELAEVARRDHGVRKLIVVNGGAWGVDNELWQWAKEPRLLATVPRTLKADWNADCDQRCNHGPRRKRPDGTTYCPAQGSYRNGAMVDYVLRKRTEGAWIQVAAFFENPKSSGTLDCVNQARAKGLPVLEFGRGPNRKEDC